MFQRARALFPFELKYKKRILYSGAAFVVIYTSYKASEARRFSLFQGIEDKFLPHFQLSITNNRVERSKIQKIIRTVKLAFRFLYLMIVFLPAILCVPLLLVSPESWTDILVFCIGKAGAVFIKVAQYVSHRRDLIGSDLANKFFTLRENAPQHSFSATQQIFKEEFGLTIEEAFSEFSMVPIASGSIAQVYKAVYKSQSVAVKIRHPHVEEIIEGDLSIIFHTTSFLARMFSALSWMELPVTVQEVKKVLLDQTDLRKEAENLCHFNQRFKKFRQICFPKVFPDFLSAKVLVESFEEAKPISFFIENKQEINSELARIGLQTFNRMLFFDNFIHADCHAGNLLVRIKKVSGKEDSLLWKFQDSIYNNVQALSDLGLHYYELALEKLFQRQESKYEAQNANSLRLFRKRNYDEEVQLVLIDVGMVTVLNDNDRKNFLKLIKYVIYRNPIGCVNLMRELSQYKDEPMSPQTEMSFNYHMQKLFEELGKVPIHKINVGLVLQELLGIVRNHKMRLEGHFATLLTNLIVLEGLAKDLDPEINIVGSTTPFLLNSTIEVLTS